MLTLLLTAFATPFDPEATRDAKTAHWDRASAARDAVIAGDLGGARSVGGSALGQPRPDDPIAQDARVRLAGPWAQLQRAEDLSAAAQAVGALAQACGSCHTEHAATRSFLPPEPPGPSPMEHHRAGAEWMWSGIVGASPELFARGVHVLAAGNLVPDGLPAGTPSHRLAGELEVQVQDLAQRALRTTSPGRRAGLYGEVLVTCASCHRATAGGPARESLHTPTVLTAEMHAHFALLTAARQSVQDGDLASARARGLDLVTLDAPTGLPDPWRPYVAEMKQDAAGLAHARDLPDAGQKVASLALTCASCHTALQAGPTAPTRDAVDLGPGAAMEVLWIALLSASTEGWALGVDLLGHDVPGESPEARAASYGRLLAPSR